MDRAALWRMYFVTYCNAHTEFITQYDPQLGEGSARKKLEDEALRSSVFRT